MAFSKRLAFEEQFAIIPAPDPAAKIVKEMFELFNKIIELTAMLPSIPAALYVAVDTICTEVFIMFTYFAFWARPYIFVAFTVS